MKTYYFTLASDIPKGKNWDAALQREVILPNNIPFGQFCTAISQSFGTEVRGCESKGYNNQGSYFYKL